MLRRFAIVLFLSAMTAFAASAQQTAGTGSSTASAPQTHKKGHWMRGKHDPAKMTQRLTKKLNLTSDQQAKVQSIFESQQPQMDSIRQDKSLSKADKRAKFEALHNETHSQIRAILNPDQQQKFDEMVQKHEQKEQSRKTKKGAAANSNSAPQQ